MPPLNLHHHSDLARIYSDPDVARHIGASRLDIAGTRSQLELFESEWQDRGYGQSAVITKADGEVVGRIGLHYWDLWREVELGYVLQRSAQGQGFAFEGSQEWIRWAERNLAEDHLIAVIEPENTMSIKLAEKLGFTPNRHDVTPRGGNVRVYRRELDHQID